MEQKPLNVYADSKFFSIRYIGQQCQSSTVMEIEKYETKGLPQHFATNLY